MIAGRSFYLSTSSRQAMTASSVFFRIRHQIDSDTGVCSACGMGQSAAMNGEPCRPPHEVH